MSNLELSIEIIERSENHYINAFCNVIFIQPRTADGSSEDKSYDMHVKNYMEYFDSTFRVISRSN